MPKYLNVFVMLPATKRIFGQGAKRHSAPPAYQQGDAPTLRRANRHRFLGRGAAALAVFLLYGGVAAAQDESARQLRHYIGQQAGGLDKLIVPDDAHLPPPRLPGGTITNDPRFRTTEAKRYLGKLLFFDPIRTARMIPQFGGVLATRQTGSCGSCHLGEVAGKSGTLINLNVGGEGRGYTNASGKFIPRRRPRVDILPRLRQTPLFPGDALVDELPTLTDVYQFAIGDPGRFEHLPPPGLLLETGRLDALDSVGRNTPSMVGVAFNNRQLLGGFAGELDALPGALNPFEFPAAESVAQLLLDAHRMKDFQSAELQEIPAFVKLFRDAFPEEAAQADAQGNLDPLINDITVLRATATFMRTIVTRNTPFDKFVAGNNKALTAPQLRGAKLFFTAAKDGGAGCFSCHSGPMLNKQVNDPDVTGTGQFVEQNFFNLGLSDHPIQALNRLARNNPDFIDNGRMEITGRDSDIYKFRSLTMRQLKGSKFFFHNGAFTNVRDVVQYFNAGVPQNPVTGAASTLTPRFTNPRGPNAPPGLGLSNSEVDDITDFLRNALYDPAFVKYDPNSTTITMQPNARDLTYSVYRPDLAALGAKDGFMPSGLPISNNDPLSRRDAGLEFLDVTNRLNAQLTDPGDGRQGVKVYKITNSSSSIVDTNLLVIVHGLSNKARLVNASGITSGGDRVFLPNGDLVPGPSSGDPYIRVLLPGGVLNPGQSIKEKLVFERAANAPQVNYTLSFLSGQGKP
ncbi:MAG: cytochrome-c peroxidase [Bryobacteraceae bacterium]